jgi:hypothetical protein
MPGGVWINRIRHVSDGEAVNGAIDSRPTRALEGNGQYLKDRIDSAELGEAVCAYGETVEPDALVGMAVYRNNVTARYERALAAVTTDRKSGTLVPAPSSDCIGIVVFKWNATKADILLAGRRTVDISQAVAYASPPNSAPPGRYYLSAATPGMLVQQKPPVSVSVLVYTDDGIAIVQPIQRDFMEDHIHYRFRLYSQPAGLRSLVDGGIVSIDTPDVTKYGWLPVDHFDSSIVPTGAVFGYNLATHPELARVFPPIPPDAAAIFLDRGQNHAGGTLIPMGPGGLCIVDRNGIWWMSDCAGDAPWPDAWVASDPQIPPLTYDPPPLVATDPPECPRAEEFKIILSYTVMVFTTEKTVVTSLRPAPNSPLVFTNCDGQDATTGDLCADLDLAFLVDTSEMIPGCVVFKELDNETFKQGYVVEGLKQGLGCSLISLSGLVTPDGIYQGVVEVTLDTSSGERELPADLIRLAQTQERFHLDIPYIGFDPGRDTSLRMRFYVPTDGIPDSSQVAIRMQLLGRAGATLPSLGLSYRKLQRPPLPPWTPVNLPGLAAEVPLAIDTAKPVGVDQYIEVQSTDQIPVVKGDTILVTLTRLSTDGYVGEVGLMRPVGVLTSTTSGA